MPGARTGRRADGADAVQLSGGYTVTVNDSNQRRQSPPVWFGCNYFFDAGGGPLLTIRVARVGGVVTGRAMMI